MKNSTDESIFKKVKMKNKMKKTISYSPSTKNIDT